MNREERLRKEQGKRLQAAREKAGYSSARAAAIDNGWPESTYRTHESGTRTIGQDDAERYARRFHALGANVDAKSILFAPEGELDFAKSPNAVPVIGFVGAGAEILPEMEQVPPEGLDEIELPFPVPDDLGALRVRGDSMLPAYRDGDAILVWKEQRRPTDSFIGDEAAVRTNGGFRFLKEIQLGSSNNSYDLYSHNAKLIRNVKIEWVGEIYIIVRASQIRRAHSARKAKVSRLVKARDEAGTHELPLRPAK